MERDNWFIIKNSLASFEQAVKVYYQATEPVSSIAKSAGSSSSSKSNLGWPFNGSNKEKVLKLYENLSESKMWKLSTGKYVEKAMYDMVKNLNYEHPVCFVILDMNDKNWEEYFSADELDEINEAANMEKQLLPTDFQTFLDGIPKTTDLRAMFSHLSTQIIDPFQNRALYWLKKSLQDAADMFITRCLPIVRNNLLDDVDRWSDTVNFVAFWQERARTATVVQSRATCSSFVDNLIMEVTPKNQVAYGENIQDNVDQNINVVEQENDGEVLESSSSATMTPFIDNNASSPTLDRTMDNEMPTTPWIIGNTNITDLFQQYRRHVDTIDLPFPLETSLKELLAVADILFLAPMDHSPAMMKIFGQRTLNDVCNQVLGELMPANTAKISDSDFIKVTDTINVVDSKAINVREGKRDLLNLAATMNNTIGSVIEGLANLLTKLPRLSILDMSKIGEVELQSTYFDVFLSEIIADQDQQVALRWANKFVHQDLTDMRPDAIISTIVQHEFGCPLGFGEAKVGNVSTTKQSVNLDIFRLGITCKRAIERYDLPTCLAFMINGYSISFFIVSKRHDCLYIMMEIASLDFASSLCNLHTFATRKNLDLLAAVSYCFWSICTQDLSNAATATTLQEGLDNLVTISNYMSLMAKSSKGTLGQSFQY